MKLVRATLAEQSQAKRIVHQPLFRFEQAQQTRAILRRIAQHEFAGCGVIDAARFEILQRALPLRMCKEKFLIITGDTIVDAIEVFSVTRFAGRSCPLASLDGNAIALGDTLHGFRKRQLVVLHEELKNTATGLAAETVVDSLFFAYRE